MHGGALVDVRATLRRAADATRGHGSGTCRSQRSCAPGSSHASSRPSSSIAMALKIICLPPARRQRLHRVIDEGSPGWSTSPRWRRQEPSPVRMRGAPVPCRCDTARSGQKPISRRAAHVEAGRRWPPPGRGRCLSAPARRNRVAAARRGRGSPSSSAATDTTMPPDPEALVHGPLPNGATMLARPRLAMAKKGRIPAESEPFGTEAGAAIRPRRPSASSAGAPTLTRSRLGRRPLLFLGEGVDALALRLGPAR